MDMLIFRQVAPNDSKESCLQTDMLDVTYKSFL